MVGGGVRKEDWVILRFYNTITVVSSCNQVRLDIGRLEVQTKMIRSLY